MALTGSLEDMRVSVGIRTQNSGLNVLKPSGHRRSASRSVENEKPGPEYVRDDPWVLTCTCPFRNSPNASDAPVLRVGADLTTDVSMGLPKCSSSSRSATLFPALLGPTRTTTSVGSSSMVVPSENVMFWNVTVGVFKLSSAENSADMLSRTILPSLNTATVPEISRALRRADSAALRIAASAPMKSRIVRFLGRPLISLFPCGHGLRLSAKSTGVSPELS